MSKASDLIRVLAQYRITYPAFRSKPVGQLGSPAREEQEFRIALEDEAVKLVAAFESERRQFAEEMADALNHCVLALHANRAGADKVLRREAEEKARAAIKRAEESSR